MVSQNLTLLAKACYERGVAHVQKNEWDSAIGALTDSLRHDPVHPNAHYYRGRAHSSRRDYAAACTLARLDYLLTTGNGAARQMTADVTAGRYFLRLADRRIAWNFEALKDNDDPLTTAAADAVLGNM